MLSPSQRTNGLIMSAKSKTDPQAEPHKAEVASRKCFVIMPIADMDGYEPNHFLRVYEHLIKPAIEGAGYEAQRADFVNASNYIIIDILRKIVESDIVVCDLSGRNPNVLYELGVRQAFNLPTVLIKDKKTPKIFDIQGLRYAEYSESLRIDEVQSGQLLIQKYLVETVGNTQEVNSMIQLLGVSPASLPNKVELSNDTSIILESLKDIASRISNLESDRKLPTINLNNIKKYGKVRPLIVKTLDGTFIINGEEINVGETLYIAGSDVGTLLSASDEEVIIKRANNSVVKLATTDSAFSSLTGLPF